MSKASFQTASTLIFITKKREHFMSGYTPTKRTIYRQCYEDYEFKLIRLEPTGKMTEIYFENDEYHTTVRITTTTKANRIDPNLYAKNWFPSNKATWQHALKVIKRIQDGDELATMDNI